ncbi:MAG: toxin [Candidatus Woykebacteria bacterium]
MKHLDWDEKKNQELKGQRDISFEEVVLAISEGAILDIMEHPNPKSHPNQKLFVVNIENYAYLVPFVEDMEKVFLKTIIPSRKATKKYIINRK